VLKARIEDDLDLAVLALERLQLLELNVVDHDVKHGFTFGE
jgi:hypothetical protein